jgi:hypothetical protein
MQKHPVAVLITESGKKMHSLFLLHVLKLIKYDTEMGWFDSYDILGRMDLA